MQYISNESGTCTLEFTITSVKVVLKERALNDICLRPFSYNYYATKLHMHFNMQ